MKIKLVTVREIPEEMFYYWVDAARPALPWLDADQLLIDKTQSYTSSEYIMGSLVKAETTIEIENE